MARNRLLLQVAQRWAEWIAREKSTIDKRRAAHHCINALIAALQANNNTGGSDAARARVMTQEKLF